MLPSTHLMHHPLYSFLIPVILENSDTSLQYQYRNPIPLDVLKRTPISRCSHSYHELFFRPEPWGGIGIHQARYDPHCRLYREALQCCFYPAGKYPVEPRYGLLSRYLGVPYYPVQMSSYYDCTKKASIQGPK